MKNIKLLSIIASLTNAWFWLPIWVLYYLKFTDYMGIGIIETVMIVTSVITEIPTGAIADLLGKKKTLIIAFLFMAIGQIWMGLVVNYSQILISVFMIVIGISLYSGTFEAMVFDSLKGENLEDQNSRVLSNIESKKMWVLVGASLIGGLIYKISPGLPYIVHGVAFLVAIILALFLTEPEIDSEKFSWKNYINQTKYGVRELFKSPSVSRNSISILSLTIFLVLVYQMIDDISLVEFGFRETELTIYYPLVMALVAILTKFSVRITEKIGKISSLILLSFIYGITLMVSPLAGFITGGFVVFLRLTIYPISNIISIDLINQNTESKYRATTISTFYMIRNLPYIFLALTTGFFMDMIGVRYFAVIIGILTILVSISVFLNFKRVR